MSSLSRAWSYKTGHCFGRVSQVRRCRRDGNKKEIMKDELDNHEMDYADERRDDAPCPHCRGSGQERVDRMTYPCPDCDGTWERLLDEV